MNKRAFYLTLAGLVAGAGLVSLLFIPSQHETALMLYYDKQYSQAYHLYKELYNEGDRSISVMVPLVWLELEYARTDRAIALLEEYVALHPDSLDAKQYLGEKYQDTGRFADYLMALMELYREHSSVEFLRPQEKIFRHFGKRELQIEVLKKLASQNAATRDELFRLSRLLASEERIEEALDVIEPLILQEKIETFHLAEIGYAVGLIGKYREEEEALRLASGYIGAETTVNAAEALAQAFYSSGLFDAGTTFLEGLPQEIRWDPSLFEIKTSFFLEQDLTFLAFEFLKNLYASQAIPVSLYEPFLRTSLEFRDLLLIQELLSSTSLDYFTPLSLLKVLERSIVLDEVEMGGTLRALLGEKYLADKPALSLALAVSDPAYEEDEIETMQSLYSTDRLDSRERFLLGSIYYAKGYHSLAVREVRKIDEPGAVHNLGRLVHLYLALGLGEEAFKKFDERMPGKRLTDPWLTLLAATGREEQLEEWLSENRDYPLQKLIDLYYAAIGQDQNEAGLMLAKRAYDAKAGPKTERLLAEALTANARFEDAIAIYRFLRQERGIVEQPYLEALNLAAKQNPSYRDELKEVADLLLQSHELSDKERRNIGYVLADHGWDEAAASVFFPLAQEKPFEEEEVQSLLALWGARAGARQLQWIEKRTMESTAEEKGKWLQYLIDIEKFEEASGLVTEDDLEEDSLVDVYLRALAYGKQKEKFEETIAYLIPEESRLPRLKEFGKLAKQEDLPGAAENVYRRIIEVEPEDGDSYRELGFFAFYEGANCEALNNLELAIVYGSENPQVDDIYGDLCHFFGYPGLAEFYWQKALACYETQTVSDKVQVARLWYKLGHQPEGLRLLRNVIKEYPDKQNIQIDYANKLIDFDYHGKACRLLQGQEDSPELNGALVRWYREKRMYLSALRASRCAIARHPEKALPWVERAAVEQELQRRRLGSAYLRRAIALEPQNSWYRKASLQLLLPYLPYFSEEVEYRKTGETKKELLTKFEAYHQVYPWVFIRLRGETDHVKINPFQRSSDGRIVKVNDVKVKGELRLESVCYSGATYAGELYGGDRVFGVGGDFLWAAPTGAYRCLLQYHKPNWDYDQTVAEDGSRDLAGASWTGKFLTWCGGYLGLAVNRFNLQGLENAASTYTVEGEVSIRFPKWTPPMRFLGEGGYVSFNYNLDGEYIIHERKRANYLGERFIPFPFDPREEHSLTLFFSKQFNPMAGFEGYGGYSYDRISGLSPVPVYGARILLGRQECLHGQIRYSHTVSTTSTQEATDTLAGEIKLVY